VADEPALLGALEGWFSLHDPDLVIGWNVVNFDFRLLLRRAELHKRRLRLGRGRELCFWRSSRNDPQSGNVIIPGRMVLDGIDTLKSATWQFPSYSLDAVASELLGRGKDIEDVANRGRRSPSCSTPTRRRWPATTWKIAGWCGRSSISATSSPSPSSAPPSPVLSSTGWAGRWRRSPTSICHGCTAAAMWRPTCRQTAGWQAPAAM
jgi:hypothetical protein